MLVEKFHVIARNGTKRLRAKLKCDKCGNENYTSYDNFLKAVRNRDDKHTVCRRCAGTETAKTRIGKPAHNKGNIGPRGDKSKSWKGGRYIDPHGYAMVHVGGERNRVGWSHYKKEHVVVIERDIGRKLRKNECIHHIDGDKKNNILRNLFLTTGHKHHRLTHASLQHVGYELYRRGIIDFDRTTGQYFIKE